MPETKNGKVKKPRRSHAFGGCGTCRRRHVKCDQVHPVCLTCRAVGVPCEGFRTELKWVSASEDKAGTVQTMKGVSKPVRQHLYTEKSRVSMSSALQSDLADRSVDESLTELEAKAKDFSATTSSGNAVVGPFGVLDFSNATAMPDSEPATVPSDDFNTDAINNYSYAVDSVESIEQFDGFLNWSDLFELDNIAPEFIFQPDINSLPIPSQVDATDQFGQFQQATTNLVNSPHPASSRRNIANVINSAPPISLDVAVHDAQLLLKHFQDKVIGQMFSFPSRQKGPFNTLTLQSAVQTLSEVSYLGTHATSHAAFSNLLAALAISSTHLAVQAGRIPDQENLAAHWSRSGSMLIDQAKRHLQWSLQTEIQGPNKAKYKDQLMAIKAMLGYSIVFDHQRDARCYTIDAEKLLRLRGLAKRTISRRCRLLHHFYTWARIMGETTYVIRDYNNLGCMQSSVSRHLQGGEYEEPPHAIAQPGHNSRLDEFLRLERRSPESDLDATGHGGAGHGEPQTEHPDMEFGDPREWSEGMYTQLYGVSETWLSLVSQTTRLANMIDSMTATNRKGGKESKPTESLERRKERLENMVCSFAAAHKPAQEHIGDNLDMVGYQGNQLTPHQNIVRALDSALVIFFYRRIRNVNPWILQEHVNSVMQALKDFQISLETHQLEGPGSAWPAFMAGCEALTKSQRDFFSSWMENAWNLTGFTRFKTIRDVMLEVWRRRDQAQGGKEKRNRSMDWTWVSVSREKNIYLMLS